MEWSDNYLENLTRIYPSLLKLFVIFIQLKWWVARGCHPGIKVILVRFRRIVASRVIINPFNVTTDAHLWLNYHLWVSWCHLPGINIVFIDAYGFPDPTKRTLKHIFSSTTPIDSIYLFLHNNFFNIGNRQINLFGCHFGMG